MMNLLEKLCFLLTAWLTACGADGPTFHYNHFVTTNVDLNHPEMQGVRSKTGTYKMFASHSFGVRFSFNTNDFKNVTESKNYLKSPNNVKYSSMLVFDDQNQSGFFENSEGGLIFMAQKASLYSADFGETWKEKDPPKGTTFEFNAEASMFFDPVLENWISTRFDIDNDESYLLSFDKKLQNVHENAIQINGQDDAIAEIFQMYEFESKEIIYGIISYKAMEYHYTLGNLKFGNPTAKTELKFEPKTTPTPFDYGKEMNDVSVISEGLEIKTVRTLLASLGNIYRDIIGQPTRIYNDVSLFPKELKVRKINGILVLTQIPSPIFLGKTLTMAKVSVSNGYKALTCSEGISLYVTGQFKINDAGSKVGFYVRADSKAQNYTSVGYDDSTKHVFVKRSGDVMSFPEDSKIVENYVKEIKAPFTPNSDKTVGIGVMVDYVTLEAFFGKGEVVFSLFEVSNLKNDKVLAACSGGSTEVTNIEYRVAK